MIKTISNLKKIQITKNNFRFLPKNPGVYIFWGSRKVIYIGKAVNLKNRLTSYLQVSLDLKTQKMVKSAKSVSFIKVENELQALLLEAFLIKKYQPKYNIVAKDDKSPLYIKISNEKYPRVITARKIDEEKQDFLSFYGPFPSSKIVKDVLKLLRKAFSYSDHKVGKKACIYSQIGLCDPCPSVIESLNNKNEKKILRQIYLKKIKIIKSILDGNYKKIQNNLFKEMNSLSTKQEYEKANIIKKQLKSLDYITQPIVRPKYFSDNPNLYEDLRKKELSSLALIIKKVTGQIIKTERLECYDISHISGVSTAASMVVFIDGQEEKSKYRHFKIRQKKTRDDLSSLSEVAKRRIKHLNDWGVPDLIIVDGGVTQTKLFYDLLKEKNIPVIGIAKRFETLVIPKTSNNQLEFVKYRLSNGPVKMLVQRIRNEAHRFAQRYHNIMFSKFLFK